MATENILMDATKNGGDRQDLHENIRLKSIEAGRVVKVEGKSNNMLELIAADPAFKVDYDRLKELTDPKLYIGRCPEQVDTFLNECVRPLIEAHKSDLDIGEQELKV